PVVVEVGENTPPVELVAVVEGSIHVELTGAGPKTASVFAQHEEPNYPFVAERKGDAFVLEHLPLGRYAVFSGSPEVPKDAVRVDLRRDGERAAVTLDAPAELYTISGRVVDEAGVPVLDAWVTARLAQPPPFAAGADNDPVLTNEQGEFTLEGL